MKKRVITAVLVGGMIFGAVYAFAASQTVTTSNLGAGDAAVTACGTIAVEYETSWDAVSDQFEVDEVVLTAPASCAGYEAGVELLDSNGDSLGGNTADELLASGANAVAIDDGVAAEDVVTAAVTTTDVVTP